MLLAAAANPEEQSTSTQAAAAAALNEFVTNEPKEIQLFVKGSAQEILPRCKLTK